MRGATSLDTASVALRKKTMTNVIMFGVGYICGILTPLLIYGMLNFRQGYLIRKELTGKMGDMITLGHPLVVLGKHDAGVTN